MLVMLSVGLTISRGLSPIIKAYAEITLGKIGDYNLTQELLRNARIYLENGEYSRSILYATTTVDYEMRRRFSILAPYSFPTLIHQLVQCGSDKLSTENIETMIMLRNKADQVKCKCELTKENAMHILSITDDILGILSAKALTLVFEPLKYRRNVYN